MVVVDVVVVAALVLAFIVGLRQGLFAAVGLLAGIGAGGLAATAIAGPVLDAAPPSPATGLVVGALAVSVLVVGTALGLVVGLLARNRIDRTPLRSAERALGGVTAVVVGAVALSFAASGITLTATPAVGSAVASSRVLRAIEDLTPAPVGAGMSQLRAALLDDRLPAWGEVQDAATHPLLNVADPELVAASASVVRVSGAASGCDRMVTGSGFVIAPGRILTNAHLVAGVDAPRIEVPGGPAVAGRVVHFDPQLDVAVLAFDGVTPPSLVLGPGLEAGSSAALQGYPAGGPLVVDAARVLWRSQVTVRGTWGEGAVPRDVYAIDAEVHPGDSGGPMLAADGTVAGIVFARDDGYARVGYVLSAEALRPLVDRLPGWRFAVDTGACVD